VPKSPECYARNHLDRIKHFPEGPELVIDSRKLDRSQDDRWRHELDHDVESVFWLLLYWAMVAQPQGGPAEPISADVWTSLIGNFKGRNCLLWGLRSDDLPDNLTHSVYEPLWPLISSLAAILVVDRHWLPESDVRNDAEYMCEAFQRLILQFIDSNRNANFMTDPLDNSLRIVQGVAQSEALTTTPSELRDGSEREGLMDRLEREIETKRRRLDRTEVGCVCAIFEFLSFLLLCSQDEDDDDNGSSRMIE
jgi:hypothetical protein